MCRWITRNTSGIERPQSRFGALAEAYVTGCCEIHAHFRASTVEGGILGDWCAFVKKSEKDLDFVNVDTVGDEECESGEVIQGDSVGQPVLIFDRELVKLPEGGSLRNLSPRLYGCSRSISALASRSIPPVMRSNLPKESGSLAMSLERIGDAESPLILLDNGLR